MIVQDFSLATMEDGILVISLAPATPVGGWEVRFWQAKRFGGIPASGMIMKSCASGFYSSGITLQNSGQGVFNVSLWASEMSGREQGNYAWRLERLTSGAITGLSEGFRQALN